MISQTSEELITTAPTSAAKTANRGPKARKLSPRSFDFLWKRDSQRGNALKKEDNRRKKEELVEVKIVEGKTKNAIAGKTSFDFFKNIKKHMQIKKLTTRKSKQKTKEIEVSSKQNELNCDAIADQKDGSVIPIEDHNTTESKYEESIKKSAILSSNKSLNVTEVSHNDYISESLNETSESYSKSEDKLEVIDVGNIDNDGTDNEHGSSSNLCETSPNNETQHLQLMPMIEHNIGRQQVVNINESSNVNVINDNKVKASLTEELLKLSNYGWYWGPISGNEADAKLISEPDGAFLVRDSSDDRYVLTLSFKSSGKLLHARMEHSGGLFSLCNQSESEGFSSVADLIDYSMSFSQSAVFCYSRPKYPGYPSFPVRLTKPVSRFTQVRSLQYLCRFVIRQNTRLDNIHKLPLPKTIKGYIEEAHY